MMLIFTRLSNNTSCFYISKYVSKTSIFIVLFSASTKNISHALNTHCLIIKQKCFELATKTVNGQRWIAETVCTFY